MMSLIEVSLRSITFKQYVYKLKGYSNLFYGLLIAQILGLFFSVQGVRSSGFGSEDLFVSVKGYTADIVIVFSLFWIMVTGFTLANKSYKNTEFSLVANRLSSNLSNIGFLLTCSIFVGITASLSGVLFRVIGYFGFERTQIQLEGFILAPGDLFLGIFVTMLYLALFSSIGYIGGVLVELNKSFVIIIPVLVIGFSRVYGEYLGKILRNFYESTLLIFILKILILTIVLFGISILLSNRMEVRK